MSKQITIRLSDESLEFIDAAVAEGGATSRANALDKLARRARRRAQAEEDALVYARTKANQTPKEAEDERGWGEWATANATTVWADLD